MQRQDVGPPTLTRIGQPEAPRVAAVHDWLTTYVGGERVLEQILALYPQADLFSSIDTLAEHERAFLGGRRPITSPAQGWRFIRKHYRACLPILMYAIEQLDVGGYDVVLSSSSAIAIFPCSRYTTDRVSEASSPRNVPGSFSACTNAARSSGAPNPIPRLVKNSRNSATYGAKRPLSAIPATPPPGLTFEV